MWRRRTTDWTVATLFEHFSELREADKTAVAAALASAEKAVSAALAAADRAVAKAEEAAEARFKGLNELRTVVQDVMATLVTREAFDSKNQSMAKELGDAVKRFDAQIATSRGTSTGKAEGWGMAAGVVGMLFGVISTLALIATLLLRQH